MKQIKEILNKQTIEHIFNKQLNNEQTNIMHAKKKKKNLNR